MKKETDKKLFSRLEIAQLLGVSVPTIDRELQRGRIPHVRIGSRVLFTQEQISQYLNQNSKQVR